ncbi:hypothetical protein GPECTOR_36g127 [Gonium pectorale]|uniref:Uncharacterized protein n=1 Tax=Gonium pectorale TaxID=33097 RepID=A0A150GCI2_GONPE|nr:hypothetical protein GPECTOR_36g127 [Gonium pectorale]|eukprot:KXZ47275.1 hypothetical protein GPECTOR_36g127 [Gonium pectorale]
MMSIASHVNAGQSEELTVGPAASRDPLAGIIPPVQSIVDLRDARGQTLLMAASAAGSVACVRLLIAKGADPWQADRRGVTALHIAASSGHAAAAELLLDAASQRPSPNPNSRTQPYADVACKVGVTPLHCAVARSQAACAAVLLRHGASITSRAHAVLLSGKLRTVFHIPYGLGSHATPLHLAAYRGDLRLCKLLLTFHLENSLVRAKRPTAEPRLNRTGDGLRPLDLAMAAAPVADPASPLPSGPDPRLRALLDPTSSLAELMPEVVASTTAIRGHQRLEGVVPTLQQLAAAALSQRLAASAAAAAAATQLGDAKAKAITNTKPAPAPLLAAATRKDVKGVCALVSSKLVPLSCPFCRQSVRAFASLCK